MDRVAIVVDGTNPPQVLTFVRGDTPEDWPAPAGTRKVTESDLPAGWIPAPQPTQPVPESVSPYQFRSWCLTHGVSLSQIDSLISAIPDQTQRELVQVAWEYGLEVRRSHPMIASFGAALGLADEQIDQAFREAAELS